MKRIFRYLFVILLAMLGTTAVAQTQERHETEQQNEVTIDTGRYHVFYAGPHLFRLDTYTGDVWMYTIAHGGSWDKLEIKGESIKYTHPTYGCTIYNESFAVYDSATGRTWKFNGDYMILVFEH